MSDHLGRENTMFIAFTPEALAVFHVAATHSPPGVVHRATTNYGIVYTAKGAFFASVGAARLFEKTGSWNRVSAMIACDLIAAVMALVWLKPVAACSVKQSESMLESRTIPTPVKVGGSVA